MQRQAGVNVFTDGEYRRFHFIGRLIEPVEGFVPGEVQLENPQACRLLGAVTTIAFGAPSRDSGPSSP